MAIWLKVTLLLIYLAVLFLLARLIEVVTLYEHGQFSRGLLDPMALSVLKLKALLEQRGVSYEGVVEKAELKQLVEATGSVDEDEIDSTAVTAAEEATQITNFTGHLNFYEQVEDAKDSMWLVEVITDTGGLLSDTSWHIIRNKVSKFGVRFGRFDCHLNMRMCASRQWYSPQLVLALPAAYKTKANVALHSFSGPTRITSLFDWIKVKVNAQIETITDVETLQSHWLDYNSVLDPEVRVVFISTLSSVPLFLSALSVKFPGRVKIGHIDTKTDKGKLVTRKLNVTKLNGYFIITKDKRFFYGSRSGETCTFGAMELFLKSLYPNMNDLFICSMILTNIACCFEIVLTSGNGIRRLIKYILCMFKFNLLLMLLWVLVLGIVQTGIFNSLCLIALKGLRVVTTSGAFSVLLKDLQFYSQHVSVLLVSLGCMLLVSFKIKSKYFDDPESPDGDEESDWWNFSNLQTLDYSNWWETTRLRPFDQIFNPTAGIMGYQPDSLFDFHEPVISKDYIKYLPTWKFVSKSVSWKHHVRLLDEEKDQGNSDCDPSRCDKATSQYIQDGGQNGCQEVLCGPGSEGASPSPSSMAECLMDSNYSCECDRMCLCGFESHTDPQEREDGVSQRDVASNVTRTSIPPVTPEEPFLEETSEDPFAEFSKPYGMENLNQHPSQPAGYQDARQCVICLDNFYHGVILRGLPCYHVFHNTCILAWLMRENHICPVCRAPANGNKGPIPFENLHDE